MDMEPLLAVLLLAAGLALLCTEFFIPSGGMILVTALICFAASVWCAWKAWGTTDQTAYWWLYVCTVVLLVPAVVGSAFYIFPKTSLGRKFLLQAPTLDEVTPYAEDEEHLSQLIGKIGQTLTLLNPGGLALVEGERMHCESEGMMIDRGENVEVVAVTANRIVVRPVLKRRPPPDAPGDPSLADRDAPDDDPRLDFDVPQS